MAEFVTTAIYSIQTADNYSEFFSTDLYVSLLVCNWKVVKLRVVLVVCSWKVVKLRVVLVVCNWEVVKLG